MRVFFVVAVSVCAIFAQAPFVEAQTSTSVKTSAENRIRTQLSARDAVVVSSELAAKIAELPLREGDSFKRGATLVAFDCSLYDAQLKKAEAVAESAKQSVLVNKRMAELNSVGALEVQLAINKAKEAEADVNYMLASVRKCVITAPYNGRVAKRMVANHQYVNMGTPLLDILDSNQLEVQMIVPSRWLVWLKPGLSFSIAIEELGKNYAAKVTQIGARIDAISQTVTITGKMELNSPELLAGMSGWASFSITMTDTAASPLISLIQLGRSARTARDASQLGFVMVNETLALLSYRQASLWLSKGFGKVGAVSGVPQPDPNAPYVQWLAHVHRHLSRVSPSSQMIVSTADLPDTLASEWESWLPVHGLWLPLVHQELTLGGLFLARDYPWSEADLALSKELMDIYSHALASYNPLKTPGIRDQIGKRKAWIAGGFVALCVFPIPMSVLAPAKVVPREPFLVRAPQNGVIDSVSVRPNQTVEEGALLLSLDPRVLKSQHELAQQAYSTAEEEYRQSAQLAVTEDKGKLEMTVRHGQLLEKSVELNYSLDQLERVQLKAERAGVVVFTDVNDWLGKAVVIGEKILTLADPNRVELHIDLPANDIIPIAVGARVKLYPNASPMSSYTAKVVTISYEAVPVPSGVLAYRVNAELDADQPLPRIGLMGTAKISGNWVPLVYYLLRKPLTAARQWTGW